MKLSICMMVKDEEKNLDRCLKSLEGIRKEIETELIIVDTGSSDRTVEIAKKYTNKIFFHEWNNNFSDMRNITISYATGEWIFGIDADEELLNSKEIVESLKEDNEYGTISIMVRNFTTNKKDIYVDSPSYRFFRNKPEFKYTGAVHNQPVVIMPVKNISAYIYHYGYNSNDNELMEKKYIRTRDILITELKKNPEDIYYRYQLSITYAMKGMWRESLKESLKTHEILKKSEKEIIKLYSNMYGSFLYACLRSSEFEYGEKLGEFIIKIEKNDIDINFYMAELKIKLSKNLEAIKYYEKYLELIEIYKKNPEELKIDPTKRITTLFFEKEVKNIVVNYYYEKDKDKLLKLIIKYDFESLEIKLQIAILEKIILENEIDVLKKIYTLYTEKNRIEEYIENILKEENEIRVYLVEGMGRYGELNKIYLNIDESEAYIDFIIKLSVNDSDSPLYKKIIKKLIYKYEDEFVSILLDKIDSNFKISELVQIILDLEEKIKIKIIKAFESKEIRDINTLKFMILLQREKISKETNENFELFNKYLSLGELWIKNIYNNELIKDMNNINNIIVEEDRFFVAMYNLKKAKTQVEALQFIKIALQNNQKMKNYLNYFIKELV